MGLKILEAFRRTLRPPRECYRQWEPARKWSNQLLRRIAPLFSGAVINVSGWKDEDKEGGIYRAYFTSAECYFVSNYKGVRGIEDNPQTDFYIDLSERELPSDLIGRFDIVFNHTTLEHIFDVRTAFRNLCLMSRDVVIVVVPFAQNFHPSTSYGDYWRFTPCSLRELFRENGLEVVFEAASPGRNLPVYLLFVGSRVPDRWRGKMPPWEPIEQLGNWIGGPTWIDFGKWLMRRIARSITRRLTRLLSRLVS
jgi:hypothetical protein